MAVILVGKPDLFLPKKGAGIRQQHIALPFPWGIRHEGLLDHLFQGGDFLPGEFRKEFSAAFREP